MARVLASMSDCRVGQLVVALVDCGVYAMSARPAVVKASFSSSAEALSELTIRMVTTSFGFVSIQLLISPSQVVIGPAFNRSQLEWQRSQLPLLLCTCAERSRTPAPRAVVAL